MDGNVRIMDFFHALQARSRIFTANLIHLSLSPTRLHVQDQLICVQIEMERGLQGSRGSSWGRAYVSQEELAL